MQVLYQLLERNVASVDICMRMRKRQTSGDNGFASWVKIFKYFRLGMMNVSIISVAWNIFVK
jgi:hypothetical protein